MEDEIQERPFEGGSQPVAEHPPEVPARAWPLVQVAMIVIAVLAVAAAALWLLVPIAP